jgi:hypothetical protein
MPHTEFSQFHYYPALLSSPGEHRGYRELPDVDKKLIIPIFELSQRGNPANLDDSKTAILETSAAQPFILDLCKDPAPAPYLPIDPSDDDKARFEKAQIAQTNYNNLLANLLNPADGFHAWRQLVSGFKNAVPTIQFTDASTQARQIIRQAARLSEGNQSVAIRITQESGIAIYPVIANIISILGSPNQILIVIDCGQGRQFISPRAKFARDAITQILANLDISERPLVRAVCMANSFPRPTHQGLLPRKNYDWRLWREAREAFPFTFGDYGAMHRIPRSSFVPPGVPTVVFPLDDEWLIYRHDSASDPKGWIEGSKAIVTSEKFANAPAIWGTAIIQQASSGDISGIDQASYWHASKVNIHIHRQIDYAKNNFMSYGDDDEPPEP